MSLYPLLDPTHAASVSDATEQITFKELADRVARLKLRFQAEGLLGARLCLPVDAGLGSMAALIALLEIGARVALIPRPAANDPEDWPAFCDAVLLPPEPSASIDTLSILRRDAGEDPGRGETGKVWVRTSGSTGTPKWVLHETPKVYANARAMGTRLGLRADDRVMVAVPINHMYGFGAALIPSLQAGASVRLVSRGNPLAVFQAQRAFEPTVTFLVPSQCRSIMALGRKAGRARLIVVAGDRLSPAEAAAFEADHGLLVNHYGCTEMGAMTAGIPDGPADLRHVTTGPVLDGVKLALEPVAEPDPADEGAVPMRLLPEAGFRGYCDPATGALLAPAPQFWSTSDLVRLHDGPGGSWIEVMGRTDHAVNRDGLLVHLAQVEGCLARARGVAQAAVAAAGQTRRGIGLTAFVTLSAPGATEPEAILAHCRGELQPRAVPDVLYILDEMPMLASGKIDRKRLAALASEKLVASETGG